MKTDRVQEIELKFDLRVLPPPTVPVVSWAEARANYVRGPVVSSPENAIAYFSKYIGGKEKEAFLAMYLDLHISEQSGHPFRTNPATHFGAKRPPVSVQSGHLCRVVC